VENHGMRRGTKIVPSKKRRGGTKDTDITLSILFCTILMVTSIYIKNYYMVEESRISDPN